MGNSAVFESTSYHSIVIHSALPSPRAEVHTHSWGNLHTDCRSLGGQMRPQAPNFAVLCSDLLLLSIIGVWMTKTVAIIPLPHSV